VVLKADSDAVVYHVFEGLHHFDLIGVWREFLFDGFEWQIVLYVLGCNYLTCLLQVVLALT
ncbi:MAG: hypothetical protein ABI337_05185, partial [Nitrososphaera sp.]